MMPLVKQHIGKVPISVRQFIKFCMVGVTNTALDIGAYYIFTRFFGVFYLVANILAFTISATNSYTLNRIFTFKSRQNKKMEYSLFMTMLIFGLILAEIVLYISVSIVGLDDLIGKLTATAIVLFWNFFGSKFLVFNVRKVSGIFRKQQVY